MTFVLRVLRQALVLPLTMAVGAAGVVAPEHVHERDDHHPKATVHRHLAPHHGQSSHDLAHLDDDDAHVVWLTTAWLQAAVYHVPHLVGTPATVSTATPPDLRWSALVLDESAPPHGPPRAPRSMRGPPPSHLI